MAYGSAIHSYARRPSERVNAGRRFGSATLVAGAVVVANTSITANSVITFMPVGIANAGFMGVTLNPGVGFTINSSNAADVRVVKYTITESV